MYILKRTGILYTSLYTIAYLLLGWSQFQQYVWICGCKLSWSIGPVPTLQCSCHCRWRSRPHQPSNLMLSAPGLPTPQWTGTKHPIDLKQPGRVTNMNCKTQKSLCIISTQAFWMALLLQVTSDTSRTSAVVTLPHTETTPPIACSQQAWRAWCSTPHKKEGIILGKTTVVTRSGWHVAKDTSCHLQICRFGEFLNTHARTGTATAEESQEFEAQKCKHICHQHSNTSWLEVSWKTASQASSDVGVDDETVAWSFWAERVDQRQFSKAGVGQRRCPSKTMCSWGCCDLKPPLGNRSACFAEAGTINKPRVQFRHQFHHRIQRTPLRNVWKGVACTSCLARVISYWGILHISFHQLVIFV